MLKRTDTANYTWTSGERMLEHAAPATAAPARQLREHTPPEVLRGIEPFTGLRRRLGAATVLCVVAALGAGSPGWAATREAAGVPFETFAHARAQRDYALACAQFAKGALQRKITPRRPRSLQTARRICARALRSADKDLDEPRRASLASTRVVKVRVKPGRARVTVQTTLFGVEPRATGTAITTDGHWKILDLPGGTHVGRSLVLQVPSSSMRPTLQPGDSILVDQDAYRDSPPVIGDIVVFYPPAGADRTMQCAKRPPTGQACATATAQNSTSKFVKRIVAGPGDRISIRDGQVIRNGARVPEDFIEPCGPVVCEFPRPFTVAADRYYLLGDNRGASDDSRNWGPIAPTAIIGRVQRLGP